MDDKIASATVLLKEARAIVALTGAGISTEAGIPDFRGQTGLWNNPELLSLMSARGFQTDPAGFYRASLSLLPNITSAKPTLAHKLLAELETRGKLTAVVTQNIDGLHQAADIQGQRIDAYKTHPFTDQGANDDRSEISGDVLKYLAAPNQADLGNDLFKEFFTHPAAVKREMQLTGHDEVDQQCQCQQQVGARIYFHKCVKIL